MSNQRKRTYESTDIPTLRGTTCAPGNRDLLLKLYEQTGTTWRALVDVANSEAIRPRAVQFSDL